MDPCETTFIITNQTDIDDGPLQRCPDSRLSTINVRDATGTLTFSNLTYTQEISVQDSPRLEILDLPDLDVSDILTIDQAISLTNISLPHLGSSFNCSEEHVLIFFRITNAPSLVDISLRDLNCLLWVELSDVGKPPKHKFQFDSRNMSVGSIITDVCLDLGGLTSAGTLQLSGERCDYQMGKLTSVQNLLLNRTVGDLYVDPVGRTSTISPVRVEADMVLESTVNRDGSKNEISLRRIETIGGDLNITSHDNVHIAYDDLTGVGKSLYLSNNTNCTFNFKSVSTVDSFLFADNVDTMLPSLSSLERAENIHVNGLIDTSIGPNIFPALRSALNVTVNASNDDFDCSELVSQRDSKIIHNLQCVGKNNQPSSQGLTTGEWAGIGVSTGVVAIGILGALIWLIIHYRRRVKTLETEKAHRPEENGWFKEPDQSHISQLQEVCGRGIFREKPDDPLVEMPTQPAELPMRPHSRAETESGEAGQAL
ncbi:hypothetical protein F4679DRAFT_560587 [Xylaria curta]|nr:hypothetical protein F4679DRAFT_560587 [Xylaria curta]